PALPAARLDLLDQERAALEADRIRESTDAPQTGGDCFVVYGRVLDMKGVAVPDVTVAALPPKGSALAETTTAEDGTFEIIVKLPAAVSVAESATSGAVDLLFLIEVSSRKPRVQHLNSEVFEATANRMAYREIILHDVDASQMANKANSHNSHE